MEWIVILGIVVLIAFLLLGVPVFYSFAAGSMFILLAAGIDSGYMLPTAYGKLTSVVLLSIPMFIMAGGIMAKGKLGGALIDFVELFLGRIKGCLGLVVVVASGIFGSISGSGAATMSCVGSILAPRMKESGYPVHITAAILCCSATLGLLIPPSITQILYAWTAMQSVLACFLAIVAPGILMVILLCIGSYILLRKCPDIKQNPKLTTKEWGKNAGRKTTTAVPALLMPFIILGGIYGGFMTPTEAAAISVFYAVPVCIFIYRGIRMKDVKKILVETATDTGVIMIMIAFAMMLSSVLTRENIPQAICNAMLSVSDNPIVILILINLFMIMLGMIMDDTSATLLCATMMMPIVHTIGMSPIQFAAILGVNLGMGCITPPSAPFLYLASRICKCPVNRMMKPVIFLLLFAYIPVLIVTTYVPQFSLFLPQTLMGLELY